MEEEGGGKELTLLQQLERILSSDPLIDELGFVDPSQIASLHETSQDDNHAETDASVFWCSDHKLAIAMPAVGPLYTAAKRVFVAMRKDHQKLMLESKCGSPDGPSSSAQKLLSCSRILIVLNSSYKGAWDARKQIFKDISMEVPLAELKLSSLALSLSHKCEEAWAYRRWVIQQRRRTLLTEQTVEDLLKEEFKLVEMAAERSRMNYRAWRHCCWLVSLMSPTQVLHELERWKKWAQLHVADNCCFHFRRCLLQFLLTENKRKELEVAWLDEIEWNKKLMSFYIGREALWVHRRFLFLMRVQYLKPPGKLQSDEDVCVDQQFTQNEMAYTNTCITSCNGDECEESQKQRLYASTYKLWILLMQNQVEGSNTFGTSEHSKKELNELAQLLKQKASFYNNLWEGLLSPHI